mmetsp:Transcript_6026/g.17791  ORF Transcript_6026/g.17791 Transcript_6026/m.17791 type:complete len:104 (-) Transcript_6026:208-519(-)
MAVKLVPAKLVPVRSSAVKLVAVACSDLSGDQGGDAVVGVAGPVAGSLNGRPAPVPAEGGDGGEALPMLDHGTGGGSFPSGAGGFTRLRGDDAAPSRLVRLNE